MENKDYILGFNHGYVLTREDSDLSDLLLLKIDSKGGYVQGMKDGRKQFYKEVYKEGMYPKKEKIEIKKNNIIIE